jgi:hypothetical protein
MTETRFLRVGSVNGTPIMANIAHLGAQAPVFVTLTADYTVENPGAGWPAVRPFLAGRVPLPEFPYTVANGSTIALLQCEADALIEAGAAAYA